MYKELNEYAKKNICPMHMPGHKRNIKLLGTQLPYKLDITEIDGFDNLHNPTGIILDIERRAARLYGCDKSFLMVNGSTGGILASLKTVTDYGDKVIIARNCHKSVYDAVRIFGLNPVYIMPDYCEEWSFFTSVSVKTIENALNDNKDAKAVVITSPTYEGALSDIAAIKAVTEKYKVPLIVDSAHGAHILNQSYCGYVPPSKIADITITSLHKTLPALTQCALLNYNGGLVDINRLKNNLSSFQTSSPSYVLMSSADKCVDFLSNSADCIFDEYKNGLNCFYKNAAQLKNISVKQPCQGYDMGKIIIGTQNTSITGVELARRLRNDYLIETEMSTPQYVLAMTSVCDSKENLSRLNSALADIDLNIFKANSVKPAPNYCFTPSVKLNPSDSLKLERAVIPLEAAENRVSLEYIYAYPPGIPIIAPGEIFTNDIISITAHLIESGVNVLTSDIPAQKGVAVALL